MPLPPGATWLIVILLVSENERGADGGWHGLIGAADGAPHGFVQEQVVGGIFHGEIHLQVACPRPWAGFAPANPRWPAGR